jgi:hypothetical protein
MAAEKKDDKSFAPLPISPMMQQYQQIRESLQFFRENLELLIEFQGLRAKINKATYQSMVEEGFSASEAIAFVIQKGV